MNLIDEFWKQLRLEEHKNDFLQDYRLALLDVAASLRDVSTSIHRLLWMFLQSNAFL